MRVSVMLPVCTSFRATCVVTCLRVEMCHKGLNWNGVTNRVEFMCWLRLIGFTTFVSSIAAPYVRFCSASLPNIRSHGAFKHLLVRLMRAQHTKPSHTTKATIVYMRMPIQTCPWRWLIAADRRSLDVRYFVTHITRRLHDTGVCARVKRMAECVIGDTSSRVRFIWYRHVRDR